MNGTTEQVSQSKRPSRALLNSALAPVVLCVLVAPLLVGVARGPAELQTNSGYEFPAPRLSFDYPGELSAWLGEKASLKDVAVRADAWIDTEIFRERPAVGADSPRVAYGNSGVLFIADAFNEACSPHILTPDLTDRMHQLGEIITQSGREFRLVISPDKSTILPEYLPEDFPLRGCFEAYNKEFWDALKSSDIAGFVDLRTKLLNARSARREVLYKKRDSHWDDSGAIMASSAIVNSLVPRIWEDSAVSFNGISEYFGDLNILSGETLVDTAPSYSIQREGVESISVIVIDDLEHGRNRRLINKSSKSSLISGRTLIFGDSFSEAAEPFFTGYFEDLTLMRLVDFSALRFIELINNADRIIFWTVERTFPYRVAFDWGTPEFLDQLSQALS